MQAAGGTADRGKGCHQDKQWSICHPHAEFIRGETGFQGSDADEKVGNETWYYR